MADDPALKRVRRAIGTVCEACGKHFDTSYGFDKHRTSGYLVGTPCHVLDDGSTRAQVGPTGGHIAADNVNSHAANAETRSTNTWYNFLSMISTYPKKLSKLS